MKPGSQTLATGIDIKHIAPDPGLRTVGLCHDRGSTGVEGDFIPWMALEMAVGRILAAVRAKYRLRRSHHNGVVATVMLRFDLVEGSTVSNPQFLTRVMTLADGTWFAATGHHGDLREAAREALRAATILRPEGGTWKVVHRHADTITTPQTLESIVQ